MYPIKRAMITMEIVIKTAAVTPPTTPLLSVQVQLLSEDVENANEVKFINSGQIMILLYQVRTLTVGSTFHQLHKCGNQILCSMRK